MIKKVVLSLLAAGSVVGSAYAQKACATDEMYWKAVAEHPEILQIREALEKETQSKLALIDKHLYAKGTAGDTTIYDIPLVVHIVHDYGSENILDNAIYEAVKHWTDTYMTTTNDTADVIPQFKPLVGTALMRFHLATIDPYGKPTKGVTRRYSYTTVNGGENSKVDFWPPDKYMNIWFTKTLGTQGAAAYAYIPGSAPPYGDGVISLHDYIDHDNTIPHEIGHELNLAHVWGSTNQPEVACGDDNVGDTPPTKGHNPQGCTATALYDSACNTGNGFVNAQNIMDYTYCSKMFTKGQVARMRAAVTSNIAARYNLWSSTNLEYTGAMAPRPDLSPTPDFSVEIGVVPSGLPPTERSYFLCANDATQFSFKNQSWNDTVTNVSWTFSNGATNATSTNMGAVSNQFTQPGWVTVALTATGNNTGDATTTRSAVYAADPNYVLGIGSAPQDFSNATDIGRYPMFNYYNNTFRWEAYGSAGYDDGACIRYRGLDNRPDTIKSSETATGDYDDFFTPAYDLGTAANTESINLNFYTSGTFASGNSSRDSLEIYASVSCGRTWTKIGSLKGSDLLNVTKQAAEFVPSSGSQWKAQTMSIPTNVRSAKTFFKFRYKPYRTSNAFYLDKLGVSRFPTEIREVMTSPEKIQLYPNPTQGDTKLLFTPGADGKASYCIKDVTGKVVYSYDGTFAPNKLVQQDLNNNMFPASGIYFVSVSISRTTITEKLIVEKN